MREQFLKELKALLYKYDVTIGFDCDGDTHGIQDERIVISHRMNRPRFEFEEWGSFYGYGIDASDIKENIK